MLILLTYLSLLIIISHSVNKIMKEENLNIANQIFEEMKVIWPLDLSQRINRLFSGTNYILCYLIEQNKEVISKDISSDLNMSTPRVSAALNALEKKNYIIRKSSKDDARKTLIVITEDGKKHLEEVHQRMINFLAYLIEDIGLEEITHFQSILLRMRNALINYHQKGDEKC